MSAPGPDAAALEAGRRLFAGRIAFLKGVVAMDGLPDPDRPEVAFAGRSNVGKSSLINALAGRNGLARTSDTPGRTQELNFFDMAGRLYLVDLPGYGYAKAPKPMVERWQRLIRDYLRGRVPLRLLVLLIDARHGLKGVDETLMDMLDEAGVPYRAVLTKADKVSDTALARTRAAVEKALKTRAAAAPEVMVTSARKGWGLEALRARVAALAASGEQG